jgi:membrane-bound serine protease (ClpP class)
VPTHGALAVAGAVTFVLGTLMLFDPAGPAYQVSLPVALAIAGTLAVLLGLALTRVVRAARRPVAVGVQELVGHEGVVTRSGLVRLDGELWRARAADGAVLAPGAHVRVEEVGDDLKLVVGSVSPPGREERS